MHSSLSRIDHRPWPIPQTPWSWRQSWCDLLFAHWPIKAEILKPLVPKELTVQEFDGTSWIGVVPFHMKGVMRRPLPDLPWISAFPELNLRIYVEHEGKAGVWFLSLDAANPLAVLAARMFFNLPYYWSRMKYELYENSVKYLSQRRSKNPLKFIAEYKFTSEPYEAKKGTLEHWLTERYCLFARSPKGNLYRTDIHHHPWQLQKAEAQIIENDLFKPFNINLEGPPALLHFSKNINVVVWDPIRLN